MPDKSSGWRHARDENHNLRYNLRAPISDSKPCKRLAYTPPERGLMRYFHVEQNEIDERLFNIFVGISLGNKLLTPDIAKHYIRWAHEKTCKNVVILIADKIDAINWQVFRGLSREAALLKTEQIFLVVSFWLFFVLSQLDQEFLWRLFHYPQ